MDNIIGSIGPWLIADLILVLIILLKLFQGRRQGAVKKLGKLAALICGIAGGKLIKDRFADAVSGRYVEPFIGKTIERAGDKLGIGSISENLGLDEIGESLGQILQNTQLPGFLTNSAADEAMKSFGERTGGAIDAAIGAATVNIALQLTSIILFVVSALLIFFLVKLIFNGILDAIIRKLPIFKSLNKLLGAVIGVLEGIVIAGLILLAAYKLMPRLSEEPQAWLSSYSVSRSYVVKTYFKVFPEVFS